MNSSAIKRVLWWGRHGNYGPNYPRNRTIIQCLKDLGYEVIEFQPRLSKLGMLEAALRGFDNIGLVWVPCFRHRDVAAAAAWARKRQIPLIFDPLISAYDKRVNEKAKFPPESARARRLLQWETGLFSKADALIADTERHKRYFAEQLQYNANKIHVIPVSAEESLFYPEQAGLNSVPEVLFFGTFIRLQGPELIAKSLELYQGPKINLTFLGNGPERDECEQIVNATEHTNVDVRFEDWIDFHELPGRIRQADICLGIFGTGEKSHRVIPNKVYQALACGVPVFTMRSEAYPKTLLQTEHSGLTFCEAGNPGSIADTLTKMVNACLQGELDKNSPRAIYDQYFSNRVIKAVITDLFEELL